MTKQPWRNDDSLTRGFQGQKDVLESLDALKTKGVSGLLEKRNEIAAREAALNTEKHLAALAQEADRREKAEEAARKAAQKEAERLASLPSCTECASRIEGRPSRCPKCQQLGVILNGSFHALPQIKKYLANPAAWPPLAKAEFSGDGIAALRHKIRENLLALRSKRQDFDGTRFEKAEALLEYFKSALDDHSKIVREHQRCLAPIVPPEYKASSDDIAVFKRAGYIGAAIGFLFGWMQRYGGLGVGIFFGALFGGVGYGLAYVWLSAKRTSEASASEKASQDAAAAAINLKIQESQAAGIEEIRFLALSRQTFDWARETNNGLRDIWERMCEEAQQAGPAHMARDQVVGPLDIEDELLKTSRLLEPEGLRSLFT